MKPPREREKAGFDRCGRENDVELVKKLCFVHLDIFGYI